MDRVGDLKLKGMSYKGITELLDGKLYSWRKFKFNFQSSPTQYESRVKSSSKVVLTIDPKKGDSATWLWNSVHIYSYKTSSHVFNLEGVFRDPFNISKEEAELFRLEYGFDYPRELIDDL